MLHWAFVSFLCVVCSTTIGAETRDSSKHVNMSLSYLKGLKTRYRNALKREVSKTSAFIARHREDQNIDVDLQNVNTLMFKTKDLLGKFEDSCERFFALAEETNAKEELLMLQEQETDETAFTDLILEGIAKLSTLEKQLLARKTKLEASVTPDLEDKFAKLLEMQVKTQSQTQLLIETQQAQLRHIERLTETGSVSSGADRHVGDVTSVRLPTLELETFYGDILKWNSFWDLFLSTVHGHAKLSSIEKFTYLRSKLGGEALKTVEGITLSNDNYEVAITLLKERYGDTQTIVNAHYTGLMDLPAATNNIGQLRNLYDKLETHLRSLEAAGESVSQNIFTAVITSKLPKDVLTLLELQKGHTTNWTVSKLRELLRNYVLARECAERNSLAVASKTKPTDYAKNFSCNPSSFRFSEGPHKSSAESLVIGETHGPMQRPQTGCRFCGGDHWSDECTVYRTLRDRKERIRGNCFICLRKGHRFKDCKSEISCYYCHQKKSHHRSLCPKIFPDQLEPSCLSFDNEQCDLPTVASEPSMLATGETVLMQTALTVVGNPNTALRQQTRILLDTGSQRTYITDTLAKKLQLDTKQNSEDVTVVTFGSDKPQVIKTSVTEFDLQLNDGSSIKISANVVPKITGTIHRMPVDLNACPNWKYLWKDIALADVLPRERETSCLDILIGNDYYMDIMLPQKIELSPGLYLVGSRLGWILSGRTYSQVVPDTPLTLLTFDTHIKLPGENVPSIDPSLPQKPYLEDFWNLETIGIMDPPCENADGNAMAAFNKSVTMRDGRYFVTWPWKTANPELPVNFGLAHGRFKSLMVKLSKNMDLLKKYDAVIADQETKGIIERVTDDSLEGPMKHYVPHHAVITPGKSTTKVRIVYDASAKYRKDNLSLNECLYRGPVLLHDLCGLLMRFRIFKIGIVSDIEKAFLQVGLQEEDRDVTRFLWLKDPDVPRVEGNTQVYRFCRVPFGVISSPFLLAATIGHHMAKVGTETAKAIAQNVYVDNVITGCNSLDEACRFYSEAKEIFNMASMNLREWATNCPALAKFIPESDLDAREHVSVLGIPWNLQKDTLSIPISEIVCLYPWTKRQILKVVASVFDPLGLFSPVMLTAKLLLQDLWAQKSEWDEELSANQKYKWESALREIQRIPDVSVPRYVGPEATDQAVSYQLLCFCDASSRAYATVIYLRSVADSQVKTHLIFSKTRLAPVKKMTVPRLELLAVLIGVRALKFVEKEFRFPPVAKFIWTDSLCTLNWIKTEQTLSIFVENRVREIKTNDQAQFRYIATGENPADTATRGNTIHSLEAKGWWHGPDWLTLRQEAWPTWNVPPVTGKVLESTQSEIKKKSLFEATLVSSDSLTYPFDIQPGDFSSLTRLLRVTAWVMRFINRAKQATDKVGPLDATELNSAHLLWVQRIQRHYFSTVIDSIRTSKKNNLQTQLGLQLDTSGLIRCHGRLQYAQLPADAISPILLPKNDPFTTLVIQKYHADRFHSGVSQTLAQLRQKFWIPQGRATVKKILKRCHVCRRHEGGPYRMPSMPPLPKQRVTESPPFTYTGVDYLGPLFVREQAGLTKVWVCLFTCMAVRAIHLELVRDLSTSSFLHSLRRFIARRGTPRQIISDNASQFKLSKEVLDTAWKQVTTSSDVKDFIAGCGITWQFITELSPWMGGFYERLVGLVKRCLRKVIGKKLLTAEQLETFLNEVEAVVNSRPLVYVGDDIDSKYAITPADFLTLNPHTALPEIDISPNDPDYMRIPSSANNLLQAWKKGQGHLQQFWNSWRNDYLLSLRERKQSDLKGPRINSSAQPQLGDIILVKDNLPRASWRLGKIVKLFPGKDRNVRSASILLPRGTLINRPLCLLYPIECPGTIEDRNPSEELNSTTMPPRKIPKRLAAERARKLIVQQLK